MNGCMIGYDIKSLIKILGLTLVWNLSILGDLIYSQIITLLAYLSE